MPPTADLLKTPEHVHNVSMVQRFLQDHPQYQEQKEPPRGAEPMKSAFATNRSWSFATRLMTVSEYLGVSADTKMKLLAGTIGSGAAVAFTSWAAKMNLPRTAEVLAHPEQFDFTKYTPAEMYIIMSSVTQIAEINNDAATVASALRVAVTARGQGVPSDQVAPAVKDLIHGFRSRGGDLRSIDVIEQAFAIARDIFAQAGLGYEFLANRVGR